MKRITQTKLYEIVEKFKEYAAMIAGEEYIATRHMQKVEQAYVIAACAEVLNVTPKGITNMNVPPIMVMCYQSGRSLCTLNLQPCKEDEHHCDDVIRKDTWAMSGHRKEGDTWVCSCGKTYVHVSDEATGSGWQLQPCKESDES